MGKRILILKACGSRDEPHMCNGIFLYNMEIRGVDPVVACEKIKLATDQQFSCYDREEKSMSLRNYDYMRMGY